MRASNCRTLGFITTDGGIEYVFWRLLNGPLRPHDRFRISYPEVTNETRDLPHPLGASAAETAPCAVVSVEHNTRRMVVRRAPWLEAQVEPRGPG